MGIRSDVRLSTEQSEMVGFIEAADLWFVEERVERKGLVPAERRPTAVLEFRRYMALVGLGYRGLAMLDRDVDEIWHTFLLFTREYAAFCQAAFGSFIHHVPRTSLSSLPTTSGEDFLAAYAEVFGDEASAQIRGRLAAGAVMKDEPAGCGTEDCTDG
jgi:hypothetical protein